MVYRNIKTGLEIIVSSEIHAPNFVRVDKVETPQTEKSGASSNEVKPRKKRAKK